MMKLIVGSWMKRKESYFEVAMMIVLNVVVVMIGKLLIATSCVVRAHGWIGLVGTAS